MFVSITTTSSSESSSASSSAYSSASTGSSEPESESSVGHEVSSRGVRHKGWHIGVNHTVYIVRCTCIP
eukprot:1177209-Prorocentrum_minimum.AAC.4